MQAGAIMREAFSWVRLPGPDKVRHVIAGPVEQCLQMKDHIFASYDPYPYGTRMTKMTYSDDLLTCRIEMEHRREPIVKYLEREPGHRGR